jgi:hypothetical protein
MVSSYLKQADELLRGRAWAIGGGRPSLAPGVLIGSILGFGFVYGGVMGTFGGVAGDRIWQVVYSAAKVPLLLLATFALSLPSFFVLNTLLGVRSDFAEAVRALMTTQAGLTIILASLAPFTAFWYASTADYQAAILFNALMFAVASLSAQAVLRRDYQPLLARNPVHRRLLRAWIVIYAFVGIQMGWLLRPFIGHPRTPVQFFRAERWDNAYVIIVQMIWDVLAP